MNPKQNVHADLLIQSKISGHPNFIKTRQRSPMLPSAIGGQGQHVQQMGGRPIMPSKNNNSGSAYEAVSKPNGMVGKPPSVGRHAYGVFSSQSGSTN